MRHLIFFTLAIFFCSLNTIAQTPKVSKKPFELGETLSFYSPELKEERAVNIYLPAGYNPDSAATYPVFYLLDGSADEDFIHVAGLIQFASFPWIKLLPPVILVGIANTDRKHDFTFPSQNKEDQEYTPTAGGSAKFMHFLEKDLKPLIQHQYKTNGQSTIIGQSLGGLLATEILYKRPHLFSEYIIISPSLWWDDESLLKQNLPSDLGSTRVWLAVGNEHPDMVREANELHEKLKGAGMPVKFQYFAEKDHGDVLHEALYRAFEQLYGQPTEKP